VAKETTAISDRVFESVFGSLQFYGENTQQWCWLINLHMVGL